MSAKASDVFLLAAEMMVYGDAGLCRALARARTQLCVTGRVHKLCGDILNMFAPTYCDKEHKHLEETAYWWTIATAAVRRKYRSTRVQYLLAMAGVALAEEEEMTK